MQEIALCEMCNGLHHWRTGNTGEGNRHMEAAPRDIGLAVRALREDAGLTRQQLADRVGVSLRWLVDFEHGKARVTLVRAMDCLRALGHGLQIVPLATPQGGRHA
jgi:ribosome-binding protein aMBF1 (putative translation factor)